MPGILYSGNADKALLNKILAILSYLVLSWPQYVVFWGKSIKRKKSQPGCCHPQDRLCHLRTLLGFNESQVLRRPAHKSPAHAKKRVQRRADSQLLRNIIKSFAYRSCALHTNFYISDINIAHVGDSCFEILGMSVLNVKANTRE